MKSMRPLPEKSDQAKGRFPKWLHRSLPSGPLLFHTKQLLKKHNMATVCEEAKCPNQLSCYGEKKTATFLALGKACTRSCGFCDIDFEKNPSPVDLLEGEKIAAIANDLKLKHIVVTMVARDDLKDGGADAMKRIVTKIREKTSASLELLTSDFSHNFKAISSLLEERVDIFNHNVETVPSLTPKIRHKATYEGSLEVLSFVKKSGKVPLVKSGLMVGLGERVDEVESTLIDLKNSGCDIVTIGQYLQASTKKRLVKTFIEPKTFLHYETFGKKIGLKAVYAGPFVRSSYNAAKFQELLPQKKHAQSARL